MEGLQLNYFVLKPSGNSEYSFASREALKAYANAIEIENPKLAEDLNIWRSSEVKKLRGGVL